VIVIEGVQNPMKMSDISFLKTKANQTDLKIKKLKTQFPQFGFEKPTSAVWGRFFTLSSSNMTGSTVKDTKYFFFMLYLCTF